MKSERELFEQAYLNLRTADSIPFPDAVFDEYVRLRDSEGYKLVPVEKLEELKRDADRMISSAHLYQDECHIKSFGRSFLHNYKAMIGALNNE